MAPLTPLSPSLFASTQLHLLSHELSAELLSTSDTISTSSPATLQRHGHALLNLVLGSQRTGMGGRSVVELVGDGAVGLGMSSASKRGAGGSKASAPAVERDGEGEGGAFPPHALRVGDIVLVSELPSGAAKKREVRELESRGSRGVVTRVGRAMLCVALDGDEKSSTNNGGGEARGAGGRGGSDSDGILISGKRLWVVKLANDVTYKRIDQVMGRMLKMKEDEYSSFMRVMFGLSTPSLVEEVEDMQWIDETLNESQKEAIKFALGSREVAMIHGPPGTGKTHTLIELILQMLKLNLRLLVCGPSNISVDNIVERLAPHKIQIVRLGHPARLLPSVLNHSLEVLTQTSDAAEIVKDIRKEMDTKQASIRKTKSGKERREIYGDIKELRKEFRERERKVVGTLLGSCKVVLATLHGAGGYNMRDEDFDVVIIDEASQALEAQCWVPLLKAKKVVLAGDHLQLPPTIKSLNSKLPKIETKGEEDEAIIKDMTLETTLFDRLLKLHGPNIKRMLTTQYRMHEKIMRFPSDELYESKLVAAEAVKARLLKDLPYEVADTEDTTEPLIFFDTQGGDFPEKNEEEDDKKAGKGMMGESKSNEMEAALVKLHVRNLVEAGVRPDDIAVITPYNAQVGSDIGVNAGGGPCHLADKAQLALIARSMKEEYPGIELGSVDGFQGREKEAIVVSLVRSNAEHEVGFLGEKRRLNVLMTRPKRSLTVIGDSETLQ